MKILLQAYNTFAQNPGGGVQTRIKSLYAEYKKLGVDVHLFDKWNTKIDDYDLIHFFKVTIDNYGLMVYAHSKGKKIVVSSVVPLDQTFRIKAHLLLNKLFPLHTLFGINKKCMDLSDIIIAQSQTECSFIHKNYKIPYAKLTALPNGVTSYVVGGEPNLIKKELPFSGDFVLQVGRIDSNKNQLSTIRALKGTGIPLVIVGGPDPQEPQYFDICKKEADENVYFTGWIPLSDPRLASVYAAAKVLVLPSKKEIYGNAIIEGAIAGCNLACSNVIPIVDWNVGSFIHTFNPNSVQEMKCVLLKTFQSPKIPNQVDVFKDFFSWERVAKEHIKLYNSLINGGR